MSNAASHTRCLLLLLLDLLAGWPSVAAAQAARAELTGVVRDQNSAAIAGASLTLTAALTHDVRSTTSTGSGTYVFAGLPPGSYRLTVDRDGFKRVVHEGVRVATGERLGIDITLEVGAREETITVTADTPLLRAESGSLGQVVTNRSVVSLPLNGRNFVQLATLAPGVILPPGSSFPRINGGRPRTNEYLFDGLSVLQPEPGQVAFLPVIDAVEEFKVETNSPPAEFGRFNGGVINLTTKTGSNALRGSVFEFFRHEALNARNAFAPKTAANPGKPPFRRNQFGFVLGGPLKRDRTFFFVDYQGLRQNIGRVQISTVPTLLQREGIFTEAVGGKISSIYDPVTTTPLPAGGFTRSPFPGNTIPASRMDPAALALLQRYPLPTGPGTANNYRRLGNEPDDQDQFDVRLDHQITTTDRVFGRWSYLKDLTTPVTPLPDGSGTLTSGAIGRTDTHGWSLASSYTSILSDRVTNELRVGASGRSVDRAGPLLDAAASSAIGVPGIPPNAAFESALPTFVIDGFQQLGSPANTYSDFATNVTQVVDVLAYQRGRHLFKAGADLRFERLNVIQPPSPTGSFRFSTLFTDLPGRTGTGSPLASFLLGQVQTFSIDLQRQKVRPRAMVQEYFIQDDWKVSDRLTVNAGLRYTLNFPSTEAANQGAVFDLETEQLQYLGTNGIPRSARELHKLNLGPRLGLSYRLTDRTVVRSGFGIVWIEMAGITTPFTVPQFPFLQTVSQRSLDSVHPAFQLSNGPTVAPIPLTPDAGLGQGVFAVDRDLGSGYVQQWNAAVQHELPWGLAVEIAYTGSKITRVGIPDTNLNQLSVDQLALGPALLQSEPNPFFGEIPASSSIGGKTITRAQLLKPFPRFTTVSLYRNNVGNTNYNAIQAKVEKRFSQGLSFLVSYTRSKLLDGASSVFDAAILTGPVTNYPVADTYNRSLERDVSNGDAPNNFVASVVYELPAGSGRRFSPGGFVGALVNDWQIAALVSLQSGLPLAVTQATNFNAFAGFGTQRPNRVGDPNLPASEQSTAAWFDTAAFTMAPQFTLGNSSRNPIRAPAYRNLDLALIKRIAAGSRLSAEFRVEAFNLTNTPFFSAPNAVLGTPGFGSITSAADPRVLQLALKFLF